MKALIRKELREYAALWILPLFLCVSKAFDRGLGERFLGPSLLDQLVNVLVMTVPAAALLGFAQMVREEKHGTLSYLVHRELGIRRLIAAKAAAGLLMVAGLAFLPPLASYLSAAVFSPLRDVLQPMRLVEELCLATAAFAGYGAGVLAATLRGPRLTRGAVALAGGLGVVLFVAWIMAIDAAPPAVELALFSVLCAAACAALLGVATLGGLGREDAVRPVRTAAAVPRALALLALLVPAGWFATALGGQAAAFAARGQLGAIVAVGGPDFTDPRTPLDPDAAEGYRVLGPDESAGDVGVEIFERYEPIVVDGTPRPELFVNAGGLGARWAPIAGFPTPGELRRARRAWPERARGDEPVRGGEGRAGSQIAGAWLDRDNGTVRVLRVRGYGGAPAGGSLELVTLEPADGLLSPRTFAVGDPWGVLYHESGDSGGVLLLDPDAKRLHVLRDGDEAPRLEPLELPDGGALVAWERGRGRPGHDVRELQLDALILHGERGDYLWRGGALVPRPAGLTPASDPPTGITLRSDHDRLRPARDLVAADGRVLLHAAHAIHGWHRVAEVAAWALELTRSPVVSVVSFLGDDDPEAVQGHVFRAPLLVGGRRAWLLAAHVVLALALAARAWSRLGGRRASVSRAALWGLAILALGPVAYAAHVLLEPAVERAASRARAPKLVLVTEGAGA